VCLLLLLVVVVVVLLLEKFAYMLFFVINAFSISRYWQSISKPCPYGIYILYKYMKKQIPASQNFFQILKY